MESVSVPREVAEYAPNFQPFLLHTKNYVVQYNQLYLQRFQLMKAHMKKRVESKWGSSALVLDSIIDLEAHSSSPSDVVILGMISKEMKLRGSILDDYKGKQTSPDTLQPVAVLISDKDTLIMEDHSGRVALDGLIKNATNLLVTGVVVAVKGRLNEDGLFVTNEWIHSYELASLHAPTVVSPAIEPGRLENGKFVLFVSGLLLGSTEPDAVHDLCVQHLVEFVCGRHGDTFSTNLASRIVRVVIAGNSVVPAEAVAVKEKFSTQKYKASLSTPSKQLDLWIAQLLSSCHVDIMPGATDPANVALPQQPFHPCLFPHAARFGTFERVTNPYQFSINGVSILGHSGQPVHDVTRLTTGDLFPAKIDEATSAVAAANAEPESVDEVKLAFDGPDVEETVELDAKPKRLASDLADPARCLAVLKKTLEWGHICPTAPDTIPSYPFADRDPYILEGKNLPRVMFSGNQPGFASELVEAKDGGSQQHVVRLISVPSFRTTGTVVLCDVSDPELTCFPITFK